MFLVIHYNFLVLSHTNIFAGIEKEKRKSSSEKQKEDTKDDTSKEVDLKKKEVSLESVNDIAKNNEISTSQKPDIITMCLRSSLTSEDICEVSSINVL
jgi:hypothetical protein